MEIEELLADLRSHQLETAQMRAEQLNKGNGARAEQYRAELVSLLQLEDRLLRTLAESFDVLDKQPTGLHLPPTAQSTPIPGSKRALPPGTQLEAVYKGKTIKATVSADGRLTFKGKAFNSIASLANEVTGKEKNHLRNRKFWKITIPCGSN
jgi:hypothetical protein